MATVEERVKKLIVDKLGVEPEQVTPQASFIDDLNADSLDLVELVMAFEEEFSTPNAKVEISDEDMAKLKTVQDTINYLKDRGVEEQ